LDDKKAGYLLAALTILRLIMAAVLLGLNWPAIPKRQGWYFHHGGDQQQYVALSLSLIRQEPAYSFVNIGFSLFITPFLWLSGGEGFADVLPPVVLFNACLLAPASIVLEYLIARQLTGQRKAALFAAGMWTFLPYTIYGAGSFLNLFRPHWGKPFAYWASKYMWVQVLSDGPAAFIVMASIYALVRSLDSRQGREERRWALIAGLLAGMGFLLRPVNVVLFVLAAGIYLWQKELRQGLYFVGAAVFATSPQFVYDTLYSESRFISGVMQSAQDVSGQPGSGHTLLFSFQYVAELSARLYRASGSPLIFVTALFLVAGGFFIAVRYLAQRNRVMAGLLASWILLYAAFYAMYFAFQWDMMRHLMPIMPAGMIVVAVDVIWLWYRLHPRRDGQSPLLGEELSATR
jgi:hypothetical protein